MQTQSSCEFTSRDIRKLPAFYSFFAFLVLKNSQPTKKAVDKCTLSTADKYPNLAVLKILRGS